MAELAHATKDARVTQRDENLHALFKLVRSNQQSFVEFKCEHRAHVVAFERHMNAEEEYCKETNARLEKLDDSIAGINVLFEAFPKTKAGKIDTTGHYDFHDSLIKEESDSKEFWKDIRKDALKKLIFAAGFTMCVLIALGLKDYISFYFKPQPIEVQDKAPHILQEGR